MSYTAYETEAGEALADVSALCRHAARGASGTFTSNTTPALASVERWLTTSAAWIGGKLRGAGLSATQTDANILGILQQLNVYDVCCKVEISFPSDSSSGQPNARFQWFDQERKDILEMFSDGTLSGMGATADANGLRTPIVTGTSISRKDVANLDPDRTQHRVKRDQFRPPGIESGIRS